MDITHGPARSRSDYYYEPLPDPRTYIRLLQIQTCNTSATIQCTLTQWLREEAPPYCAISYTWGDPKVTSTIVINLKSMIIRQNCEDALRQAHAAEPRAYLWVDAICINQEDNAEKSHQVAVMASFYGQAVRVLACVGDHDSNSHFVFAVLRNYKDYFTTMYEHITKLHHKGLVNDWTYYHWPATEDLSKRRTFMLLGRRLQLTEALHYFLARPYFSRVWILQELYMGNGRITICCGTHQQPLGLLFALTHWVNVWNSYGISMSQAIDFSITVDRYAGIFYRGYISAGDRKHNFIKNYQDRLPCMALGAGSNVSPSRMRNVVETLRDFKCENPRDKVYGVLALIDWEGRRAMPTPDYNRDLLDLAKEILGVILDGKPDERGDWLESFVDVTRKVRLMLNLSPQHETLRKTIDAQNCPKDDPSIRQVRREYPRFADLRWRGQKLTLLPQDAEIKDEIAIGRKGSVYINPKQRNWGSHTAIVNCNGNAIAWAPKDTNEDDWYLECDTTYLNPFEYSEAVKCWRQGQYHSTYGSKALIVRQNGNGGYHLVGPAFPTGNSWMYMVRFQFPTPQCFRIWWHLEDALVLEGLFKTYDRKDQEVIAELGDWSKTSFCAYPGSTIIKGPFKLKETESHLLARNYDEFREPDWS